MKVGIFAYNFKHWKTQTGIQNLMLAGIKPTVIFAADPVELKPHKPQVRIRPKDLYLFHPREIAERYGVDYQVVEHNSPETSRLVKEYDLDLGLILGARILKPIAIKEFKIGVINLHPAKLPEIRGLDAIKWAVIKKVPIGVTAHFIDKNIDRGRKIAYEKINIYKDDTLLDLTIRVQNLEQQLLTVILKKFQENEVDVTNLPLLGKGSYHKSMPCEIEYNLSKAFAAYKEEFAT
jgi:folate-dependent phosphoribosylglycinamide formyltransferase PurN